MSGGVVNAFDALCLELIAKAHNAAMRNKPTMWAYYLDAEEGLRDQVAEVDRTETAYVVALICLIDTATIAAPNLNAPEAARLWARGVYARRVLQAAGLPVARPSLDWLRRRAEVLA